MRTYFSVISRLPLAGKLAIRPVYLSTNPKRRYTNYAVLINTLLLYSVGHLYQAVIGATFLWFDAPLWVKALGVAYAVINGSVVLFHIYLGARVTRFLFKKRYPKTERAPKSFSASEALWMVGVTLGGQLAVLVAYFVYSPVG